MERTMDRGEIQNQLKSYIVTQLLHGQDRGLDAQTPLLEWGIIDSLSMMALLSHIESTFHIQVPEDEVTPESFVNLEALTGLVLRRLPSAGR